MIHKWIIRNGLLNDCRNRKKGKNMTEQFFGQCEYCEEWLHGLRIHDTEQFGELELCKDCRELADNGELEECMCGALASCDGHTYCRECD